MEGLHKVRLKKWVTYLSIESKLKGLVGMR